MLLNPELCQACGGGPVRLKGAVMKTQRREGAPGPAEASPREEEAAGTCSVRDKRFEVDYSV